MSDLTHGDKPNLLQRRLSNPKAKREAVPLDPPEENRMKSPILAFELRFSAAC